MNWQKGEFNRWRWRTQQRLKRVLARGGKAACICGRGLKSARGQLWIKSPSGAPWRKRHLCVACHQRLLMEMQAIEKFEDREHLPLEDLTE